MNTIITKISLLLALCLSLVSFKSNKTINSDYNNDKSGREYFKAIFFTTGDLAENIPVIKNSKQYYFTHKLNPTDFENFKKETEIFLDKVEQENSSYLKELELSILNKNHLLVKRNIIKGARILFKTSIDIFLSKLDTKTLSSFYNEGKTKGYVDKLGNINYDVLSKMLAAKKVMSLHEDITIVAGIVVAAALAVAAQTAVAVATYVAGAWAVYLEAALWGPSLDNYEDDTENDNGLSFADGYAEDFDSEEFGELASNVNIPIEILVNDLINNA